MKEFFNKIMNWIMKKLKSGWTWTKNLFCAKEDDDDLYAHLSLDELHKQYDAKKKEALVAQLPIERQKENQGYTTYELNNENSLVISNDHIRRLKENEQFMQLFGNMSKEEMAVELKKSSTMTEINKLCLTLKLAEGIHDIKNSVNTMQQNMNTMMTEQRIRDAEQREMLQQLLQQQGIQPKNQTTNWVKKII